jgi:hypothetical protein
MFKSNTSLRAIISIAAIALAIIHLSCPSVIPDNATLVLLLIAAIPWLQPLVKSVEMFGIKVEMQQLKDQVADAHGAAESASQQAMFARVSSSTAETESDSLSVANQAAVPEEEMQRLAREYDEIRSSQSSGYTRTEAMTKVVSRMIDLAKRFPNFDFRNALTSSRGLRLAGYAYLYAREVPSKAEDLKELVETVTRREDKPFGQYWGLQSIFHVLQRVKREEVSDEIAASLHRFAAAVPRGTDRAYEVQRIIKYLAGVTGD